MEKNETKNKGNIINKIIIALVVIVLFIPIIVDMIGNNTLKVIKFDDFKTTMNSTNSYGFALIYVADSSSSVVKENKTNIKKMITEYAKTSTNTSVNAYYMDSLEMNAKELEEILGSAISSGYVFVSNGEVIKTVAGNINKETLDGLISEYSMNAIPEKLTYYKVAEDAAAYKKLVNKKKTVTMAVFGKNDCFYCNQFKAVFNTVAEEKEVDIYYFDSMSYDAKEYDKIFDIGLTIPAECSSTGEKVPFEKGFGTPLTLFTKNGKVIDCINGYVNKAKLITKLETLGMIEEE